MIEFEFIETERLLLRKLTAQQYKHLFKTYTDAELMAFFGFETEEQLLKEKVKFTDGNTTYRMSFVLFHLIEKTSNKNIGGCALHNWYAEHYRAELGYHILSEEDKRKGYMKEAVSAIVKYGFNQMKLNRIEALISPTNEASLKIVYSLNFVKEGLLRQHYSYHGKLDDSILFSLLKEDYI
jgi:ribosomal-protein-alanine N-acetyltransferase